MSNTTCRSSSYKVAIKYNFNKVNGKLCDKTEQKYQLLGYNYVEHACLRQGHVNRTMFVPACHVKEIALSVNDGLIVVTCSSYWPE